MTSHIINGPEIRKALPKHESLGKILFEKIESFPKDKTAAIDAETHQKMTYQDVQRHSENIRDVYVQLGLQVSDRVMVLLSNSIYFVSLLLGSFLGGFILCPANPSSTKYELEHFFQLLEPKLVIVSESIKALVKELQPNFGFQTVDVEELFINSNMKNDEKVLTVQYQGFNDATPLLILNSSGTTGLPKGVVHTQRSLKAFIERFTGEILQDGQHRQLGVLPFFHAIGLSAILQNLYFGETVIVLRQFKPDTFLEAIQNFQVTKVLLIPALINFLLTYKDVSRYNLKSLKVLITGGSTLSKEDIILYKERFNVEVQQAYGTTEFYYALLVPYGSTNLTSCGKLMSGVTAKVVDSNGTTLAAEQVGELCVKSDSNFAAYFRNESATRDALDCDGFYRTGDLFRYDSEGYFYIIDRIKEMIKCKGYQVSPAELEFLLLKHMCVKEAVVFGIPDERCGELPTACVVLKEDTALVTAMELQEFAAGFVSPYKRLTGGVRIVESIPKNVSGKKLRRIIREAFLNEVNQS